MAPNDARLRAQRYLEQALAVERRYGFAGQVPEAEFNRAVAKAAQAFRRLDRAARSKRAGA